MSEINEDRNVGHGHVYPRPDGVKARCGGPAICHVCAIDLARKNIAESAVAPPAADTIAKPQGFLASNLVTRLREFDWFGPPRKGADELLNEAADEIERLTGGGGAAPRAMTSVDLIALARFRILDKRNGTEEAKDRLLGQMADEIEALRTAKPARDAEHCDYPDCERHWTFVVEQLVIQCEAYHRALDAMFARMAARTANDAEPFFPSQSGQPWDACEKGHALNQRVRRELASLWLSPAQADEHAAGFADKKMSTDDWNK